MTSSDRSPAPAVARVFASYEQARDAIQALKASGIEAHTISIVARSSAQARALDHETGAAQDLEEAVQAHPLRDLLDWLGRVEAVVAPGFASVLATGDLGLHLSRASPARGAITAALVDLGLPVDVAAHLEREVLDGRILVVVHGTFDTAAARNALGMNSL
jgi:ParB-like chromosome segregation protein Spo0J